MAGSRTGVPTIIALSRKICKVRTRLGGLGLEEATTPEFKLAIDGLVLACTAFELLDDFPAEIDDTAPRGPEDLPV